MQTRRWHKSKYPWLYLIMICALGGLGVRRLLTVRADKPVYRLGTVERGDIANQVEATGTLAAVTTVQVGSQVSGNIAELYADFNSTVRKGQLLARLDQAIFKSQVEQAEAGVRTAEITLDDDKASIATTKANLHKAKVDVIDKQRKLERQKELFNQNLLARDDLDTAQASYDASAATQEASEAQLESAELHYRADQTRLEQEIASLETAKLNLEHTVITSPISGTVISRSVDRGQTVAASMSAPTLFTIGEDLTKMQVNAAIDEADVGTIKAGMQATFTVDAFRGETFNGRISQVRLAASTVQNVVTYNAIIDVANPQLKLRPGMTANVRITIGKVEDILTVPNAALRFKPTLSEVELEAAFIKAGEEGFWDLYKNVLLPTRSQTPATAAAANRQRGSQGSSGAGLKGLPGTDSARPVALWITGSDGSLQPVVVRLGLKDGSSTAIVSGNLKPGDRIVTGLESETSRTESSQTNTRAPGFGSSGMGGPPPPPP